MAKKAKEALVESTPASEFDINDYFGRPFGRLFAGKEVSKEVAEATRKAIQTLASKGVIAFSGSDSIITKS